MIKKIEKFGASWCGPCRVLDRTLENVKGVEVVRYDVDEVDESLLEERHIKNVPVMFFIDEDDRIVYHIAGAISLDKINEILKSY